MRLALSIVALAAFPATMFAQSEPTYWQDIRPIFRKHCTACHSAKNARKIEVSGGLALDTYAATMQGTKRAVVVPKASGKSVLHELLVTGDVARRMPLEGDPLPAEKIALVKKWIDGGAKEGTPPVEVATVTATKKTPTRKLEVLIPTEALLPAGVAGAKTAGKLTLGMKIGPLAPVTAVAFSPDSQLLAAGSYGRVVIWDLRKAEHVRILTNVLGAVNDLRFSPKGDILAVAGGQPSAKGDLRLYSTSDWKLLATLRGHDDVVFSIAFSPDGEKLASASFDHSVRLWNVKTHESIKDYHHHSDFVYAVAFNPNGKQLASASKDHTVQLFDVATGKSVFTFSGMEQDVMAVAFHPDGKSIVSSGFESALWWWNPLSGENIKKVGGHGIAVHELAFSKDGKRVVSAGADKTVRTWDGTAGTAVKVLSVGSVAYSVAISNDGKRIAAGSFDGLVRVWDEASGRHLVTLLAVANDVDQADWLAITPEGYVGGSDKLVTMAKWRVAGAELAGDAIWPTFRKADLVVQALRGDPVAQPKFGKK